MLDDIGPVSGGAVQDGGGQAGGREHSPSVVGLTISTPGSHSQTLSVSVSPSLRYNSPALTVHRSNIIGSWTIIEENS